MEKIFHENSQIPSQFTFLSALKKRSPELFSEYESLYQNLTIGEMGEQEVLRYFREYGEEHWQYLTNFWTNTNGVSESDLIVFTNKSCYVLEIKNYMGKFEYADGRTVIDGYEYSSDCIFQARRSFKNIRKILAHHIHPNNIHGALIFIGEHNEVAIHSDVNDIQIVRRNQLKNYIKHVANTERISQSDSLDFASVTRQLKKFQVDNPFVIEPLTDAQMLLVKTGITCFRCNRFNIEVARKFVRCTCGHTELRESATLRMICDYTVLRYQTKLCRKDLFHFMGGLNSKWYLSQILSQHFTCISNGRYTYYIK